MGGGRSHVGGMIRMHELRITFANILTCSPDVTFTFIILKKIMFMHVFLSTMVRH